LPTIRPKLVFACLGAVISKRRRYGQVARSVCGRRSRYVSILCNND
jgi:hypothetical protein